MRFVNDNHPGRTGEPGQDQVTKAWVVEPLRADKQDIDMAGLDLGVDLLPFLGVGRVDRDRPDAGPLGGGDLVAHEC